MKNQSYKILRLVLIALLSTLFSYGQNSGKRADKRLLHHETPDDKYVPGQHTQKKSPSYRYRNNNTNTMNSSVIVTVQVNVDSNQQNITGDAANEPNITVNPLNENIIAIGWRQFDNVISNFRQAGYSYTSDGGQTWTFPGPIQPGVFRSDPVLDYDSAGIFYYNSLTRDSFGDFSCQVFKSIDGGMSWNNGVDAGGGDKQWMTIDRTRGVGSGNIYSFWTAFYSSCPPDNFTFSSDGASSFANCSLVDGDPFFGTMTVGNSGELFIGGMSNSDSVVISKSNNAQISGASIVWDQPVFVNMDISTFGIQTVNPGGLIGQVNIDVDRSNGPGSGNVYIVLTTESFSTFDPGNVMFAKSTDGGQTWGAPIMINDDSSIYNTQWFGTMSVAPNGRIDVIWLDNRDGFGTDLSALYYSYSTDQGNTWSVNEKLSASFDPHVGYPNQNKMGDYFDMISNNTGAHLAWANTLNGEEDVYYSFITPPIGTLVDETNRSVSFSIYPNPTKSVFMIAGDEKHRIEIYNILGELVYSVSPFKSRMEVDISSQPDGIYFVNIITPSGNKFVKKLIKG